MKKYNRWCKCIDDFFIAAYSYYAILNKFCNEKSIINKYHE